MEDYKKMYPVEVLCCSLKYRGVQARLFSSMLFDGSGGINEDFIKKIGKVIAKVELSFPLKVCLAKYPNISSVSIEEVYNKSTVTSHIPHSINMEEILNMDDESIRKKFVKEVKEFLKRKRMYQKIRDDLLKEADKLLAAEEAMQKARDLIGE